MKNNFRKHKQLKRFWLRYFLKYFSVLNFNTGSHNAWIKVTDNQELWHERECEQIIKRQTDILFIT